MFKKRHIKIDKDKALIFFSIIIVMLLLWIIFLLNSYQDNKCTQKTNSIGEFTLLRSDVARMDVDDFLIRQKTYTLSYNPLKGKLLNYTENIQGNYGIYIEDLTTGAWLGINERERFIPASLLKVPMMVAILKKAERGEVDLNKMHALSEDEINSYSGSLAKEGVGYNITIQNLLKYLVNESDNTAGSALNKYVSYEEIMEAVLAMGLPSTNQGNDTLKLSPKEYSNIFRSLYLSAYLRRPFSQMALSLMVETSFNSQLRAGVPEEVKISHKIGIWSEGGYFHDCGIVYHPKKPYLICIMSNNTTRQESYNNMKIISNIVYESISGSLPGN